MFRTPQYTVISRQNISPGLKLMKIFIIFWRHFFKPWRMGQDGVTSQAAGNWGNFTTASWAAWAKGWTSLQSASIWAHSWTHSLAQWVFCDLKQKTLHKREGEKVFRASYLAQSEQIHGMDTKVHAVPGPGVSPETRASLVLRFGCPTELEHSLHFGFIWVDDPVGLVQDSSVVQPKSRT